MESPRPLAAAAWALALVLPCASVALGDMPEQTWPTYAFYCITNSIAGDADIGEAQLRVTLMDLGSYTDSNGNEVNQVMFKFVNLGPQDSSITDVYFDDGYLLDIAKLVDRDEGGDPTVDFDTPAIPRNLPGGDSLAVAFEPSQKFQHTADSDCPPPHWGVNPGHWLGVVFDLQTYWEGDQWRYRNYGDVLQSLELGGTDPASNLALRIGIHVQAFAGGGSESFVNNSQPVPLSTPCPASAALGVSGLALVGWVKRRTAGPRRDHPQIPQTSADLPNNL